MATKQDFEKGEMNSLRKKIWETAGVHWEPIEPSKDWVGYVLYDVNEEILEIKQNKNNKKDIVLTADGKIKDWSPDTLSFLFEDVLTAYDSQKEFRKTLKDAAKEKKTQPKKQDISIIMAKKKEYDI